MTPRPGAWGRVLATFGGLSLALGVLAAATAPGYRAPEAFRLPSSQPAPAADHVTAQPRQHPVQLRLRGRQVRGLLVAPQDPRTALVVVHGSGRGDPAAARRAALALASHGVAVLVPDKVLDGYTALHRDFAQLGEDAVEASRWLGAELGLGPDDVGLLGLSEGGWVSLLAAERHPALLGPLVLDSAPVVTPLEQAAHVATTRAPARAGIPRLVTGLLATGRPAVSYLDVDVGPALPGVQNHVVAVFGAQDTTVPVAQAVERLRNGLPRPPALVLTPGGHLPDPTTWAPVVAAALRERTVDTTWSVAGAHQQVPPLGAPTPAPPSAALDPRWHAAVATLLTVALQPWRRHKPPTQE